MLRKLVKYDLKYSFKLFLMVHGIYLLICILLRLLVMNQLDFSKPEEVLVPPITLILILEIFLLSAVSLTTSLLIALRFYRNLFSREGYLTWTLPASSSEHLLAKFCSGYLIAAADIAFIAAGILILATGSNVAEAYRQIAPDINDALGTSLSVYATRLFLFSLLFTFTTVIQIYFCIALGQLFQGHRVLFAIAFYFLTGLIVQVLTTVLVLASGFFSDQAALPGLWIQYGSCHGQYLSDDRSSFDCSGRCRVYCRTLYYEAENQSDLTRIPAKRNGQL